MKKIVYLTPVCIAMVTDHPDSGAYHIEFKYLKFYIVGIIQFENGPANPGEKGTNNTVMKIAFSHVNGPMIEIARMHEVTGYILQNYQMISDVLGGAYLNGYFDSDF